MLKTTSLLVLLAVCTAAAGESRTETLVIPSADGQEATIKVPVGAVSAFSANYAVALPDYADGQIEAMRLSGNVRIQVVGLPAPIQIEAERVVLELTADERPGKSRQLHSTHVIGDADSSQTFFGNVEFSLPTPSGALQIKADRVERVSGSQAGA